MLGQLDNINGGFQLPVCLREYLATCNSSQAVPLIFIHITVWASNPQSINTSQKLELDLFSH